MEQTKNNSNKNCFSFFSSTVLLFGLGAFLFVLQTPVQAKPKKNESKTTVGYNVSLGLNIASTFYWRGEDYNTKMYDTARKLNFAPVLQPEVTVFTPVRGLYFDLFGTFSLRGRKERDLKKNDRLDFSVVYDFANAAGFWSVNYALYANVFGGENFGEIGFGYRLPFQVVNFTVTQYASHSFKGAFGSLYSEVSLGKTIAQLFTPTLLFGWHILPVQKKSWGYVDLILEFHFNVGKTHNIEIKFNSVIGYSFPQGVQEEPWKFVFNAAVFYTI